MFSATGEAALLRAMPLGAICDLVAGPGLGLLGYRAAVLRRYRDDALRGGTPALISFDDACQALGVAPGRMRTGILEFASSQVHQRGKPRLKLPAGAGPSKKHRLALCRLALWRVSG